MVQGTSALRVVNRPQLVTVGDRRVSTVGWRQVLVEDHLKDHLGRLSEKWCDPACMSRTMLGKNTAANRDGVRTRLRGTFHKLLAHGLFLVIDYDENKGHGKILAFKIYETTAHEEQSARAQLEKMRRRLNFTEATYHRILDVIGVA